MRSKKSFSRFIPHKSLKHFLTISAFSVFSVFFTIQIQNAIAATAGLPFTEDFYDSTLNLNTQTTAKWDTNAGKAYLGKRNAKPLGLTSDTSTTLDIPNTPTGANKSAHFADLNGDGYTDVVTSNAASNLYVNFNNKTSDPFSSGLLSEPSPSGATWIRDIATGDIDRDGDIDIVTANGIGTNGLYLNDGGQQPFQGITRLAISSDSHTSIAVVLEDMNGDGWLDVVVANDSQVNRLYLNTGEYPFLSGVTGTDISPDAAISKDIKVADLNNDGFPDVVVGNYATNSKYYLNDKNIDADNNPFSNVSGEQIGSSPYSAYGIDLGDINNDGWIDFTLAGVYSYVYLNSSSTTEPFNTLTPAKRLGSSSSGLGWDIKLRDIDSDGDLDAIIAALNSRDRIFLNNGTSDPFAGSVGVDISNDILDSYEVDVADLDLDGDLDLLIGNAATDKVIINNTPVTSFSADEAVDVVPSYVSQNYAVDYGDIDNDGDIDVVSAVSNVLLLLNNGTLEPFEGVSNQYIDLSGTSGAISVKLADVNRDGLLDLFAGGIKGPVTLILNDGDATPFSGTADNVLSFGPTAPLVYDYTNDITVGDVNHDGYMDVVLGRAVQTAPSDGINKLYLHDKNLDANLNPYDSVAAIDIGTASTTSDIDLADVNGDGNLDLLVANKYEVNQLFIGDGDDSPFDQGSTPISLETGDTTQIKAVDVDKDGALDIIVANGAYSESDLTVYLNDRVDDPFDSIAAKDFTNDSIPVNGFAIGDTDKDGSIDIVTVSDASRHVMLYPVTGDIALPEINGQAISSESVSALVVAIADFNNDGDQDVYVPTMGVDRLYHNSAAPEAFNSIVDASIDTTSYNTVSINVGDFNNDGNLDVVAGVDGGINKLNIHNGSQNPFGDASVNIGSDASSTQALAVGDINKDGRLDIVAGNDGANNLLYLNNGTATPFTGAGSNVSNIAETDITQDLILADMNGDSYLDIITGNLGTDDKIYFHTGDPANPYGVAPTSVWVVDFRTRVIRAGDIDNDGDIDLVTGNDNTVAGENSGGNAVFINNGTGGFSNAYNIEFDFDQDNFDQDNTFGMALGDVNNDGLLDLVVGNHGSVNKLYLNDGTAEPFNSTSSIDIGIETDNTRVVVLNDLDHDGDLDLVVANDSGDNKFYLNNGTATPFDASSAGVALPHTVNPVSPSSYGAAIGDIDGDGNSDLIVGDYGGSDHFYRSAAYSLKNNQIVSKAVDTDSDILKATLSVSAATSNNESIDYYLSNDAGAYFHKVTPGVEFTFPTQGDDLHWKAIFTSLSPTQSPELSGVSITARFDHDLDFVTDDIDICVGAYDPDQLDNDIADGFDGGDACDDNDDNDGFNDNLDLFPFNYYESHDYDGDCAIWVGEDDLYDYNQPDSGTGCGDFTDADDDNDGIPDISDVYDHNAPPSITGSPSTVATPALSYTFTPEISDGGDGPSLTASLTFSGGTEANLPTWLSFNTSTGALTGVPSNDNYGTINNIVLTVSDGTEQVSLPSFNIKVIDTRAPTTEANPKTGNYNSDITIYLSCSDGTPSSGCATIHYTTDGWINDNIALDYAVIDIPASSNQTVLSYYSVDNADIPNTSIEETQIYTFDTILPSVAIISPIPESILITLNSINGNSSDYETGVQKIELQITDGTNYVQAFGGNLLPLPLPDDPAPWIEVNGNVAAWSYDWSYDTTGLNWSTDTVYTLTARVTDYAGNEQTTSHSFTHYGAGDPSPTSLSLSLTTTSMPIGEKTDATLTLTRLSDANFDLSGVPLELHITRPDNSTVIIHSEATLNGSMTFSQLGDGSHLDEGGTPFIFSDPGQYKMVAKFTDTITYPNLAAIDSSQANVLVATSAGYAVIIQGKLSNDDGLASHNKTANRIYETFKDRGFVDEDIFYFNYDINQNGVDGLPDKATIQKLIEGSANSTGDPQVLQDKIPNGLNAAIAARPAPIYITFVDHGGKATESLSARFFIDREIITPTELNSWITSLETGLDAIDITQGTPVEKWLTAKNPRVVIIGACYSGGFINDLSGSGRVIMTSATENEPSFKGPLEDDNIRVGEYFLEELFLELGDGNNLRDAFKIATNKTETYTKEASGDTSTNSNNEFLDTAVQHPLLDDDGDTVGTNTLFDNTTDGQLAKELELGFDQESLTNDAFIPADITRVGDTQYLNTNSADLTLYANDPYQVNQAYVEIRSPVDELPSALESATEQLTSGFDRRAFTPPATEGAPYTLTYDGFNEPGKYELFHYVNDRFTGAISSAKRSVIYRNRLDETTQVGPTIANDPPAVFDLLTPATGTTGDAVTVFTWEEAIDPEDEAVTYNFILANDDGSFSKFNQRNDDGSCSEIDGAYRQEGLDYNTTFVDGQAKLCDLTSYVWKVEAVDQYGQLRTSTNTRSYNTNDTNATITIGTIVMTVKSASTNSLLVANNMLGDSIANSHGEQASHTTSIFYNGNYLIFTSNLGSQRITADISGYTITEEDINVTTGLATEVLLNMPAASVDEDGDGINDDADNCPNDSNASQSNNDLADEIAYVDDDLPIQGDACDLDDDNDGMPDEFEERYPGELFPFVNDASDDADSDGITNIDEYRNGTIPTDPLSPSPDTDKDGVPDATDNCPLAPNADQSDTPDGDGIGDICDDDDDNDIMSDAFEIYYGLDPLDSSDATDNPDEDAFINFEEYAFGTNPNATTLDSDSDGLPDSFEVALDLNHLDTDTDGDMLDDHYEIFNALDPLNSSDAEGDTDGDTFTNLDEYLFGTNPNDATADTDGDGLPDTFEIATLLTSHLSADSDGDNLSDYEEVNYDGDPYNYIPGADTNPNASDTDADTFQDDVELLFGTDPIVASLDTDGDGLPDDFETAIGTSAFNVDTDGDNLTDYEEVNYDGNPYDYLMGSDTNPNAADTDGDVLSDDFEIAYGLNPLDPSDAGGNMDGDAFTDLKEFLYGTDPTVTTADTDSDGLPDSFEDSIGTKTDNADSDGDTLSDYAEVNYDGNPYDYLIGSDTDPNDVDTDGDTLQDDVDPDPLTSIGVAGDVAPHPSPDGVINAADLLIMQRIVMGDIATPTPLQMLNGDIYPAGSPDGVINTQDLILLRQMMLQQHLKIL